MTVTLQITMALSTQKWRQVLILTLVEVETKHKVEGLVLLFCIPRPHSASLSLERENWVKEATGSSPQQMNLAGLDVPFLKPWPQVFRQPWPCGLPSCGTSL